MRMLTRRVGRVLVVKLLFPDQCALPVERNQV